MPKASILERNVMYCTGRFVRLRGEKSAAAAVEHAKVVVNGTAVVNSTAVVEEKKSNILEDLQESHRGLAYVLGPPCSRYKHHPSKDSKLAITL